MKFSQEYSPSENIITAYGSGFIEINRQKFEKNLLVFPDRETETWACSSIETADQTSLATIIEYQPELVVLGSGPHFAFPDFELQAWLQANGVGCEMMDSAAACRTYNVLLAEKRKVAAALLLP